MAGNSADEVRVSFGNFWLGVAGAVCGLCCATLGFSVLYAAVFGDNSGVGASVAAGVVGGGFALFGVLCLIDVRSVARKRWLVLSDAGIAWEDIASRSWSAAWGELESVRVTYGFHRRFGGWTKPRLFRVRLIVAPVKPGDFATKGRPVTMQRGRHGAGPDEFSLPLGPNKRKVPAMVDGLDRFAGTANGGVIDEGQIYGAGYV